MSRLRGVRTILVALGVLAVALVAIHTVLAKSKTPPSISDLQGLYVISDKGTEYDPHFADAFKYSGKGTLEVVQNDDTTLDLTFDEPSFGLNWTDTYYYDDNSGVLVAGWSDDGVLGQHSYAAVITGSGSPGKLKGTMQYIEVNLTDGYVDVGSMSLKQVTP
jgi:hypothetical protein